MDYSLLGFVGLKEFFNVHPLFVHFPVALFPSTFLLYSLGIILKRRVLILSGRACLYLAMAGAVAAAVTGYMAADSFPHNKTIHHLMQTHEYIGIMILMFGTILTGWSFWQVDQTPKLKWGFLAILAIVVYLTLQTADIGGRMVYLEGAAVKPAVSVIAETEDAEESKEAAETGDHQNPGKHEGPGFVGHHHNH